MGIRALTGAFRVNSASADILSAPAITTLADGRIAFTWSTADFGNPTVGRGRLFDDDGRAESAEFTVAQIEPATRPDVIGIGSGPMLFAWTTGDPMLVGRLLDGSFGSAGSPATDPGGSASGVVAASLAGDRFVVAWESRNRADLNDGSGTSIVGRVYDGGRAVGTDFVLNSTGTGLQRDPAVAGVAGGGFAAAWTSTEQGITPNQVVRARLFDADGNAVRRDVLVSSRGDAQDVDVLGLGDGGFVVAWRAWGPGSGMSIWGRIYDEDGASRGGAFVISEVDRGNDDAPALAALDDGRFVAVWTDGSVRARLFDEDGAAGDEFAIAGVRAAPDVTALEGGRFAVTWTQGDAVRARVYDARTFEGTRGDDRWVGGSAKDTIDGLAGADVLYGGGGNDRILGGSGDDRLNGGRGRDVLDGGPGADVLTGGPDADRFTFRSAAQANGDRVTDFRSGEDRLDLSAIDANEDRRDDQAFVYVRGRDFSGRPGELRLADERLSGDTDGDRRADFVIRLTDVDTLRTADLIL